MVIADAEYPSSPALQPFLDLCEAFDACRQDVKLPLRRLIRIKSASGHLLPYEGRARIAIRPFVHATTAEVLLEEESSEDYVKSRPATALLCHLIYHHTLVFSYDTSVEGSSGAVNAQDLRRSLEKLRDIASKVKGAGEGPDLVLSLAAQAVEQVLGGREVTYVFEK